MQKGLGKGAKIGIVVLIVIIAIVVGGLFYLGLFSVPEEPAKLVNVVGDVQVGNSPFQSAAEGMVLKKGSSIKIGPGGSADILLFGSSVVRMDEKTQIKIAELKPEKGQRTVKLNQTAGKAWNKVLKVSGIDNYEVRTPTSVATIRGTGFFVSVVENVSSVGVAEGNVTLSTEQASVDISKDEQVKVDPEKLDVLEKKILEKDPWVLSNLQKDEQFKLDVKEKIKKKYAGIINIAKSQYGVTDEQINDAIDLYLRGDVTKEQIEALKQQYGIPIDLTF
jgi:hypothetical protein